MTLRVFTCKTMVTSSYSKYCLQYHVADLTRRFAVPMTTKLSGLPTLVIMEMKFILLFRMMAMWFCTRAKMTMLKLCGLATPAKSRLG
jgi:hypothetical protein